MPLLTASVSTEISSIVESVALGMEADGGFTLTHVFDKPLPEGTQFTLKHVYINVSGDGRNTGMIARDENKEPSIWVDVLFPNKTEPLIISKRHARREPYAEYSGLRTNFPNTLVLRDRGQIRFPITCYPIDGLATIGPSKNSNRIQRKDNTFIAAHYEARGTHVCDIPLGTMSLPDNTLTIRFNVWGSGLKNMVDAIGATRLCRLRDISVAIEYKF